MKQRIRWALAIATGLLVAYSGPARAQEDSLNLVPSKAPIVVQLNGLEKARNRLGKFLGNSIPDLAPKFASQLEEQIKKATEGRDLKAISKDGRVYIVFTDLTKLADNLEVAILVPVTGYADFKDSILKAAERKSIKKDADGFESVTIEGKDEPVFLVDCKGYVAITSDKEAAKSFVKGEGGLGKSLSKLTAKAFLDQDVGIYVNLQQINQQFGAQVKGLKGFLGIIQPGMGIEKKQIEMIKQVFDSFLALMDDGVAAVTGFDFRPEGVNFRFVAEFGEKTDTNTFLKKLKPSTLADFGKLPSGRLAYTASNFDPSLSTTLSALMKEGSFEDEDAKTVIAEVQKELAENGRTIELSAADIPNDQLQVGEYKDGVKAAMSQLKLYKSLTKSATMGSMMHFKNAPEVKENAETVGDIKFNRVKFTFDLEKSLESIPEPQREATKAMLLKFTGESTTTWFGGAGGKFIQATAKDWKDAKALIEGYLQGKNILEKDESFMGTRKQLPDEATVLFIADTARYVQMVMEMMKDQLNNLPGLPGIPQIPELKAPKGPPAYFGFAMVLKSKYAGFDVFVPTTSVQQVRKMLAPLLQGDN